MPGEGDVVLLERQRLAGGDQQLEPDQVQGPAGDGHRSSVTGCSTWSRVFISRKKTSSPDTRNSTVPAFV